MNNLLARLFKLKRSQFVIPAQAGIQIGDMLSLATKADTWQGFSMSHWSVQTKLRNLLLDWIPACAGMTGCGGARENQLVEMRVLA